MLKAWRRRSQQRIVSCVGLALLCVITQGACAPEEEATQSMLTGSSASFTIDSVEVGVGFDEPVQIDGAAQTSVSTSLPLSFEPEADAFAGFFVASDAAGNAAHIRIEVRRQLP